MPSSIPRRRRGLDIKEIIKEGDPAEVILSTVKEEKIDLIIMLAHEEGHLEHFLFGRANEAIIQSCLVRFYCLRMNLDRLPSEFCFNRLNEITGRVSPQR